MTQIYPPSCSQAVFRPSQRAHICRRLLNYRADLRADQQAEIDNISNAAQQNQFDSPAAAKSSSVPGAGLPDINHRMIRSLRFLDGHTSPAPLLHPPTVSIAVELLRESLRSVRWPAGTLHEQSLSHSTQRKTSYTAATNGLCRPSHVHRFVSPIYNTTWPLQPRYFIRASLRRATGLVALWCILLARVLFKTQR